MASGNVIDPKVKLEVPLIDLSAKADGERELQRVLKQKCPALLNSRRDRGARSHRPVEQRLSRSDLDGAPHRLRWLVGRLVVSELGKIYSALKQGAQPALETPESFRQYANSHAG